MKRVATLLMMAPVALFAAGTQNTPAEQKPGMPMQGAMQGMMSCPMNLQGTTVAVSDTPTGVAVSLSTKPENVTELRKRVEQMAAMHSGDSTSQAMMQGQMMPGTVKYEPISNGARITLTPKDPARLAEFRTQVRTHVEKMQKGECSMMQDMMQGMMKGMTGPAGKTEPKPEPKKDEVDHSAHHPEEKK